MVFEEKIIGFTIFMFVLSQISERITNFIKLYLPLIFPRVKLFDTLKQSGLLEGPAKKRHEQVVFGISLLGGIIIASTFFATFFWWKSKEEVESSVKSISWMKEYASEKVFFFAIAVFLSFGAKFWHDILDIIFSYKNAKRSLQDPGYYKLENIDLLQHKLAQTPRGIVEEALISKKHVLENQKGLIALAIGYSPTGVPRLVTRFDTQENADNGLSEIFYVDKYHFEHEIIIEKLVSGPVLAQSAQMGGPIFNAAKKNAKGTAGFLVKSIFNDRIFVLSCFHVMASTHPWKIFKPIGKEEIRFIGKDGQSKLLGTLYEGSGPFLDAALTELDENFQFDINSMPSIKKTGKVNSTLNGKKVLIRGMASGKVLARIYEPDVALLKVKYANGSVETFRNCFSICKKEKIGNPTTKGDSGGLVYLADGTALGMIVAGCKLFAYAIKLTEIESHFGIKILPKAAYTNHLKS